MCSVGLYLDKWINSIFYVSHLEFSCGFYLLIYFGLLILLLVSPNNLSAFVNTSISDLNSPKSFFFGEKYCANRNLSDGVRSSFMYLFSTFAQFTYYFLSTVQCTEKTKTGNAVSCLQRVHHPEMETIKQTGTVEIRVLRGEVQRP